MRRLLLNFVLAGAAMLLPLRATAQQALEIATVVSAAANSTVPDEDGEFPAYIELRAFTTVDLGGYYLTDTTATPLKWALPEGYRLTQGQVLRIFASGKNRRPAPGTSGQLHTSFTYDCSVPFCGLFRPGLSQPAPVLVDSFSDRTDYCACNGLELLRQGAVARTLIPDRDLELEWTKVGYNDLNWIRGPTGVGYDAGANSLAERLILHHTMDRVDVVNGIVRDTSGPTVHDGAIAGTVPFGSGRIRQGLTYPGKPGNYVVVKHHKELNPGTSDFTASIWFNAERGAAGTTGTQFLEYLVSKLAVGESGAPIGWGIFRDQNNTYVQAASLLGGYRVPLGPTAAGRWHHVVLVIDRRTARLVGYLNGKEIGSTALSPRGTDDFSTTGELFEGRDADDRTPFLGQLDDFAIWGRALSPAEIQQIYSAGLNGLSFTDPGAVPGGGQLYAGLIGTDVLQKMRGVNASAFVRVPFNLSAFPSLASGLRLRVQYDDGFIAYLNGVKVAERNAPAAPAWNSKATVDRPDEAALSAETIDLSAFVGLLRPGLNVLAFHALNSDPNAERFLILPSSLCLDFGREPTGQGCVKETNGRDFWIAFPENYEVEPDAPLQLSLCIAGPPETIVGVEIPGVNVRGFPQAFIIPGSGTLTVNLPSLVELDGPDDIEKKGVHVIATANVAVYATTRKDYTTDSFLALPTPCLGTEYLVMAYQNVHQNIPLLHGTQLAVVAVVNGTEVTITPSGNVGPHAAGVPYTITLNRGETYQLRNEAGAPADLTGTLITASKPVAVYGAHRCANVQSSNQFFCDVVVEQLLPLPLWGVDFFVVPLATRSKDTVRILSSAPKNNVTVTTTGSSQSFVLERGEHRDLLLEQGSRIIARQPILVAQFANSSDFDGVINADPFMCLIQPVPSWLTRYRLCTPPGSQFEGNYLNLVAPSTSAVLSIRVNGTPLSGLPPANVTVGALPNGFAYARVRLEPDTAAEPGGSYSVDSPSPIGTTSLPPFPFGLIAYGFSEFDSYGYPGGMQSTDTRPPLINCPAEVTIHCEGLGDNCVVDAPNLIELAEFFDDCTPGGQLQVSQSPPPGEPLQPGTYSVVITATDADNNTATCTTTLIVAPVWEEQQFGAATVANPTLEATVWGLAADPDNDGLPNLVEQHLGSDPNRANNVLDLVRLSFVEAAGESFLKVTLRRPVLNQVGTLVLEGREAFDGSPWLAGPDVFEELVNERRVLAGGEYEEVSFKALATRGASVRPTYFLRLRVVP